MESYICLYIDKKKQKKFGVWVYEFVWLIYRLIAATEWHHFAYKARDTLHNDDVLCAHETKHVWIVRTVKWIALGPG